MENRINIKEPNVLEANIYYTLIGFVFLTLGAYVQHKNLNSGLLITEIIIICLPVFLYLKIRGYDIKETLRLKKISIKQALLIPLITLLFYPLAVFFNAIILFFISFFGEVKSFSVPTPQNTKELFIGLIIIAISAGICEEILFRGFIMSSYKKTGVKKSIVLSAVLFGFFHFNIQNLTGPIVLGIIFGYMVYKTKSIFSSMIAHFTNNAFAVILSYVLKLFSNSQPQTQDMPVVLPSKTLLAFTVLIIGAICLLTVPKGIKLMKKLSDNKDAKILEEEIINKNKAIDIKEKLVLVPVFLIFFYRAYIMIKL